MPRFTLDEIRNKFSSGKDFNEIFDVFEDALKQGIQDVELYRLLFWNTELAMRYYRKAAKTKPDEVQPYLNAADCHEPDLNIPPLYWLVEFLKLGINQVTDKKTLLHRLSYLYQMHGDQKQADFYRNLADEIGRSQN